MAKYYDKDKIRSRLEVENIFDLLVELGGEPEYTDFGLISSTICHNPPGEGSRKLYYYENSTLFHCFTGCLEPSFDIFDLIIKTREIQHNQTWELYDAMNYVAEFFGFEGEAPKKEEQGLADWGLLDRYNYAATPLAQTPVLKEFNPVILTRFSYPRILSWEQEGITSDICHHALIGYYPGREQITIPHFDEQNRLIGIRGRFLSKEDADRYGKYRPLFINNTLYNHPLSLNLYGLNKSKENIARAKTAIVFEGEKSVLQYRSFFGEENDISVACCGSSLSSAQVKLLTDLGVNEIILAFDRQFQEVGDDEFIRLKRKLINLHNKYKNMVKVSIIFDKNMITNYKDAPTDCGADKFMVLLNERIVL